MIVDQMYQKLFKYIIMENLLGCSSSVSSMRMCRFKHVGNGFIQEVDNLETHFLNLSAILDFLLFFVTSLFRNKWPGFYLPCFEIISTIKHVFKDIFTKYKHLKIYPGTTVFKTQDNFLK